MAYNRNGYLKRAEQIQAIAREHYEPGRQDRCYRWVWRKYIYPVYGIGYRAFLVALKVEIPKPEPPPVDCRQLSMFGEETEGRG